MLKKLREWKYSNIVRGCTFLLMALLSIINGGYLKWVITIMLVMISVICFFDKSVAQ